jgi:hypothetical protein
MPIEIVEIEEFIVRKAGYLPFPPAASDSILAARSVKNDRNVSQNYKLYLAFRV